MIRASGRERVLGITDYLVLNPVWCVSNRCMPHYSGKVTIKQKRVRYFYAEIYKTMTNTNHNESILKTMRNKYSCLQQILTQPQPPRFYF